MSQKHSKPKPSPQPESQEPADPHLEIKERLREKLDAGDLEAAQELMNKLKKPKLPNPQQARTNLLFTLAFFLFLLFCGIPVAVAILRFWF